MKCDFVYYFLDKVITINGIFPGPRINVTTNDNVHINVYNNMDEPMLMTWYNSSLLSNILAPIIKFNFTCVIFIFIYVGMGSNKD